MEAAAALSLASIIRLCSILVKMFFRSVVFTKSTGDCVMFDVDRHVLAGLPSFAPKEGSDYMERNCIDSDPKRLCIYDKVCYYFYLSTTKSKCSLNELKGSDYLS